MTGKGTPGRHLARLVALVLLAGFLAGCTGSTEPPGGQPAPPPTRESPTAVRAQPAERPGPRACYALAFDQVLAPTTDRPPTRCEQPHTARTIFVGTLDTVVDGHLLAVDSEGAQQQVASACPRRLASFLGGSTEQRRLSMLRVVWFTPSVEASDEGADWFRCDVIALAADEKLVPLTGTLVGVLGTEPGRARFGMCGTAEPGTAGFRRVICSSDHTWRAISTVTFRETSYPGAERVRTVGEVPCEGAGRAAADDALSFRWGYEWPTRRQWDSGQTYGICWVPD